MKPLTTIGSRIAAIPPGQPFASRELLPTGSRAAVDQALCRLVKSGKLRRITPGVYVRPVRHPLLGELAPDIEAILSVKAGGLLLPSGAAAQHRFGLTDQVPVVPTYYTTGPTRSLLIGRLRCRLLHRSAGWFALGTGPVGEAAVALRSLGPTQTNQAAIAQVREHLPVEAFEALLQERWKLPGWLRVRLEQYQAALERLP
ncbi:MAG: hypothetical protein GEEBNDBF_01431 [bacterium]|nr:hypothetical protein [bacterium]